MSSKGGKISLLFGVVTGALTGLLFAPQKGKELRKNISEERKAGGLGHKAIGQELAVMVDEVAHVVKGVAKSDEVKHFWDKTSDAVGEWSNGTVELDQWAKEAHKKVAQLNKAITSYTQERRKYLTKVKGAAQSTVSAVKKGAKAVRKAAKKGATQAKAAAKKTVNQVKKAAPKKVVPQKMTPKKTVSKALPKKKSTKKVSKKK